MSQQSTGGGGLGTAHPVPYSPEQPNEKVEEKKEEQEIEVPIRLLFHLHQEVADH